MIRALNEESDEDDEQGEEKLRRPTREAQEQEAVELYNTSFELVADGKIEEAVAILEQILDLPYLKEEDTKKCSPIQLQLRLGAVKAMVTIFYSLKPNPKRAVDYLLLAVDLDPQNSVLWHRLSVSALKSLDFELSFNAAKEGFEIAPSHNGILENLITVSYLLFHNRLCIHYCDLMLQRNSQNPRAIWFKNHIAELENTIITLDVNDDEEGEFLKEIREYFRLRMEKAEKEAEEEKRKESEPYLTRHKLHSVSNWTELFRILRLVYDDAKKDDAIVRPLQFVIENSEDEDSGPPHLEPQQSLPENNEMTDENTEGPPTRRNSLENTNEATDGNESMIETGECPGGDEASKKKSKRERDVKWWQFEGTRRSERVRGNLVCTPSSKESTTKELDLNSKLKNIIPSILLISEDETSMNKVEAEANTTSGQSEISSYFGTADETKDVEKLKTEIARKSSFNTIILVCREFAHKSHSHWPENLQKEFLYMYSIYRNHVQFPPELCHTSETEGLLALAYYELTIKSPPCPIFYQSFFFASKMSESLSNTEFSVRFNWAYSNWLIDEDNLEYAKCILEDLSFILTNANPESSLPVSIEKVEEKLKWVSSRENVSRVTEFYTEEKYEELIEIFQHIPASDPGLGHMLAEAHFHLNQFSQGHEQIVKLLEMTSSTSSHFLPKTLTLLKKILQNPDYGEISLELTKQSIKTLLKIIVNSQNLPIFTTPWICLHLVLSKFEVASGKIWSSECDDGDESEPPSLKILQFAHEELRKHGKCTFGKAKFLQFVLDVGFKLIRKEIYSECELIRHIIEQAIYCGYGFPARIGKIRYLNEHGGSGALKLDLSRAKQLYDYFQPEKLPEFDSYDSISEQEAGLFLRILELITPETKPKQNYDIIKDFLDGGKTKNPLGTLADASDWDVGFRDLFYLLGDHYFKVKDWRQSTEYYTWDLSLSSYRLDSWAGISLAKAEAVNTILNSCDSFQIEDILDKAEIVIQCFQNALGLEPDNSKIRIESGSFLYSMHSFCSRLLKQNTDKLSLNHFDLLEAKKEVFLQGAAKSFEHHESGTEDDWIHHYMLGKVYEKINPHSPKLFLDEYEKAAILLDHAGATYPFKISFYTPQELAIEALEIFYRIHASILNYIEKHDYSEDVDALLWSYVEKCTNSPFMKAKIKRPESSTENKRKKHEKTMNEVRAVLDDVVNKVVEMEAAAAVVEVIPAENSSESSTDETSSSSSSSDAEVQKPPQSFSISAFQDILKEREISEKKSAEEAKQKEAEKEAKIVKTEPPKIVPEIVSDFEGEKYCRILTGCVKALEDCILRFPPHHKSYTRIAVIYSNYCKKKLNLSRDWFLGSAVGEKKKIVGLFSDRKPSNFFNGIWRNPVDDIDRPGSFPYHMGRAISNLLEILEVLNDHEMLTEIGIQLTKIPDADKRYLYNSEREQFSTQALSSGICAAKRLLSKSGHNNESVALQIYSSYCKIQKSQLKENGMGPLLLQAYKTHLMSKGMDPQGLSLEVAVKHYQHLSWSTKLKTQKQGNQKRKEAQAAGGRNLKSRKLENGAMTNEGQGQKFNVPQMQPPVSLFNSLLNPTLCLQSLANQSSQNPEALNRQVPGLLSIGDDPAAYWRQLSVMFALGNAPFNQSQSNPKSQSLSTTHSKPGTSLATNPQSKKSLGKTQVSNTQSAISATTTTSSNQLKITKVSTVQSQSIAANISATTTSAQSVVTKVSVPSNQTKRNTLSTNNRSILNKKPETTSAIHKKYSQSRNELQTTQARTNISSSSTNQSRKSEEFILPTPMPASVRMQIEKTFNSAAKEKEKNQSAKNKIPTKSTLLTSTIPNRKRVSEPNVSLNKPPQIQPTYQVKSENTSYSTAKKSQKSSKPITSTPPNTPPCSNAAFHTSPFRTGTVMISNSGQYHHKVNLNHPTVIPPPTAHAANKTPPHASFENYPEIIDLTNKTPEKDSPERGIKRPNPNESPRSAPELVMLPLKKKLMMRQMEEDPLATVSPSSSSQPNCEIITLD